jgi:hypothetical protein
MKHVALMPEETFSDFNELKPHPFSTPPTGKGGHFKHIALSLKDHLTDMRKWDNPDSELRKQLQGDH